MIQGICPIRERGMDFPPCKKSPCETACVAGPCIHVQAEGVSGDDALRGVLETLTEQVRTHAVDVVIVAGDVFDSATPAAACYTLLSETLRALADTGAQIAHSPSSNLFLGSGLIGWPELEAAGARVSLASDVGGGTSLSMLRTLADAYKVQALRGVVLRTLDMGLLQAGASVKGEFENRLKNVIDEVRQSPRPIILFIDEAHTLIGAGGQSGQNDAANLLKPALARGELRTIAATTWAEYKKYFEKDAALARRFQVVKVEEPGEALAAAMLRGMVPLMEAHFGIRILDEAVTEAVRLSSRYISSRQLPDKAVGVLDTACARVALGQRATPAQVDETAKRILRDRAELAALEREAASGPRHELRIAELRPPGGIGRVARLAFVDAPGGRRVDDRPDIIRADHAARDEQRQRAGGERLTHADLLYLRGLPPANPLAAPGGAQIFRPRRR